MRTSSIPAPAVWPDPGTHQRFAEVHLRALTPIYKGGSTTTHIDEGRPFRPTSIRGALRFWWRATSHHSDVKALRKREKEIFGGVHGGAPVASAVTVAVRDQKSNPGPRPKDKPYAFGVTGKDPDESIRNKQVHQNATATLRVEWRDQEFHDEIMPALRAWLLFGGTGGRSRRGAGSIWWSGGLDTPVSIEAYVAAWRSLTPPPKQTLWPTLAGGVLLVGPALPSAERAWGAGLDGMRDVRASQDVSSKFAAKRNLLEWKARDYVPICKGESFRSPRAALGLPIRFNSKGNGFRGVLNAKDHNRYPSPIHFKVIQIGERAYHPVFVVLRGEVPSKLAAGTVRGVVDRKGLDRFIELATQLPEWQRHDLRGTP